MKVRSSIKSLKNRHRDCQVVKRRGRIYVINKTDPRFKLAPASRLLPDLLAGSSAPISTCRIARAPRCAGFAFWRHQHDD